MKNRTPEFKVGLFVFLSLVLVAIGVLKVNDRSIFEGGYKNIDVLIDSAEGLTKKTPVEIAGIQVGFIDELSLRGHQAHARLKISRQVRLGINTIAQVRTKGFLGQTYVDLMPGDLSKGEIREGGQIQATNPYVDLSQIASDIREMTGSLKKVINDDPSAPLQKILQNIETFTSKLSEITVQNQENVNAIILNLKGFSEDLHFVMQDRKESIRDSLARLNSVIRKVDEGRGTLGALVNNQETADNINDAARGLSETLGGVNRFRIDVDYHLEYLGRSKSFKNYAGVKLRPRPDKYFSVDFVVDPNPSPETTITTSQITTGGNTSTVTTTESSVARDQFLFSAQMAKTFHDFTIRGGVIESQGGLGLDYEKGPVRLEFSAFDFSSDDLRRPHLKALGKVNVTRNFYLVSGADDFISKTGDRDWFLGGGFQFVDNDIKSLLGAVNLR